MHYEDLSLLSEDLPIPYDDLPMWITRPGDFDFNFQQFSKLVAHTEKVKRVVKWLSSMREDPFRRSGRLALPPLFPLMGLEFGQSGNWQWMLQEQHRYVKRLPSVIPHGMECLLALQGDSSESEAWDGTIELVFIDLDGHFDTITFHASNGAVIFHGYAIASCESFYEHRAHPISLLNDAGLSEHSLILLSCEPYSPYQEGLLPYKLCSYGLQEDFRYILVSPAGLLGDGVVHEGYLSQALHMLQGHYDHWSMEPLDDDQLLDMFLQGHCDHLSMEPQRNTLLATETPKYLQGDELTACQLVEQTVFLLRYYLQVKGVEGVVVGLSGGLDSAMVLYFAVAALGAEHVTACFMPTRFNAQASREDAQQLADNLGVELRIIPIDDWYRQGLTLLGEGKPDTLKGLTQENIQARLRGVLLMGLSNETGRWVLNTSNRSELAMGYSTLYGDAVGSLSVLGSFYKTELYQMAQAINKDSLLRTNGKLIIPQHIISRPPSAELREGQKDSDSLPDYDTLDDILSDYLDYHYSVDEICEHGYSREVVEKVIARYRNSSYKRQQFMPILNVCGRHFPDCPIALPSKFLPL